MLSKLVVTVKCFLTENIVRVCDVFDILKLHNCTVKNAWYWADDGHWLLEIIGPP